MDNWLVPRELDRGAVLSLDQIWLLSKLWYADRLNPDFRGKSIASVKHAFDEVGLTAQFWAFE